MKNYYAVFLLFLIVGITGCSDTGNDPEPPALASVYVTNEGNFSDSNGSVTSFDPATDQTVARLFETTNGRPLAGIIQSMTRIGDRLYIVLNNADKIEVVDARTFASVGTIELSNTPSAIAPADEGRAYVSNLYAGTLSVIDLENLQEAGPTIPVGMNPQQMVRVGDRVYVANNGFGNDNTLSVVDISSGTVESTLTVGSGPAAMKVDQSGHIWVVCSGLIAYDEDFNRDPANDIPGSLYIVDGEEAEVAGSIATGGHPADIALNEQRGEAYLLNGGIQMVNMNSMQLSGSSLSERSFSAVAWSPEQQLIYTAVSRGYTQAGKAVLFTSDGTPADSFEVGIAPNGFYFQEEE